MSQLDAKKGQLRCQAEVGKQGGQDWCKLLNSNTVREEEFGGAEGSRTPDPHNAIVV